MEQDFGKAKLKSMFTLQYIDRLSKNLRIYLQRVIYSAFVLPYRLIKIDRFYKIAEVSFLSTTFPEAPGRSLRYRMQSARCKNELT
jgi:hypothetical protein